MEVQKIFSENKEIVLVGTAHVSKKSAELVKKIIEEENPEIVGVELDDQRYRNLVNETSWRETDISRIIKEGKTYVFLASLLLSGFQKRIGEKVGTSPGREMLEAINIAREKNIPVALLDRDISITMKRALASAGFFEKIKIFYSLFFSVFFQPEEVDRKKIEELKRKDALNALVQELAREMPSAKKALVDERDLFIANRILDQNAQKIVVVIGIGHMEGVKKFLDKKRDVSALLSVPKKTGYSAMVKFSVPAIFLALLFLAITFKGVSASISLVAAWFLITGTLSALGVVIAGGHPLSAISSFIAAPFTTLHPAIASGWVAGFVEAKIRAPKVKDFEQLHNIKTYSDVSKNAVTRILLVVALSNLGSMAGTVIAFSYIAGLIV